MVETEAKNFHSGKAIVQFCLASSYWASLHLWLLILLMKGENRICEDCVALNSEPSQQRPRCDVTTIHSSDPNGISMRSSLSIYAQSGCNPSALQLKSSWCSRKSSSSANAALSCHGICPANKTTPNQEKQPLLGHMGIS